jgi:hypothetical protein
MKWRNLIPLFIAALIAIAGIAARPSYANPNNPPQTKTITVAVPSQATKMEIEARVNAVLATLPAPTNVLSGSISINQMEEIKISLVEDNSLELITDTRAVPTADNPDFLNWTNPNAPADYCSASPDQLVPELTFNSPITNTIAIYNWNNYLDPETGEPDHYQDFTAYTTSVTGTGTLSMTMQAYTPITNYNVEAYASAFLTNPDVYGYVDQSHYVLSCATQRDTTKPTTIYLPLAAAP